MSDGLVRRQNQPALTTASLYRPGTALSPLTPWPALNSTTQHQRGRIPFRLGHTTLWHQTYDLTQGSLAAAGGGHRVYRLWLAFFLLIVDDTMSIAQSGAPFYRS